MNRRGFLKTNGTLFSTLPFLNIIPGSIMDLLEDNIHEFKIGRFQCTVFRDLIFKYKAKDYFINVDSMEVQSELSRFDITTDIIPSPYISLLLKDNTRTVLIDSGIGFSDEPIVFKGKEFVLRGQLSNLLERKGISKNGITDVILTHFHPDHIGGVFSNKGQLNYPNATFHMHHTEWDFWHSSKSVAQPPLFKFFVEKNISPLQDEKVNFIKGDYQEIIDGIVSVEAPGHTAGQIALLISSNNENLLYISDAFLHPLHMEHLDWRTSFDMEHKMAKKTRTKLLDLASNDTTRVNAFHFDFPGMGRVDTIKKGWRWVYDK
ncbi:MBL fold metallo-hydrolase [Flagellimonas flava]|uniref:Glyoxylase, beta-lactamase superfamily II n=1 Tax=Flagellimonas flava TaxID=570519 RepID=A0A1M5P7X1_9FLAO|nr:MBL fold metallo-hydrolase [Allomuricauda flava]SHG97890.1 Glyoxylase, beta-lactamase superfamily II [Allomuricauda flava]